MGCVGSSHAERITTDPDAARQSKELERKAEAEHAEEQRVKKLLLLGAGESGKSTLFKQAVYIYGKGYSEEDRKAYTNIVNNNVISMVKALIRASQDLTSTDGSCAMQSTQMAQEALDMALDTDLSINDADKLLSVWKDPGVQHTFTRHRSDFQLGDSCEYFMGRLQVIGQANYVPTQQDVMRSRVRTTGIVETEFQIDCQPFRIIDVGGQRNERKKWIHAFENVTCVLFVTAISGYDQKLYEDESTNRMDEALQLFDEIVNSRWFQQTSVVLFLNKRDLFAEKIKRVPLTVWKADYVGPQTYEAGCQFLRDEFESRNRTSNKIYTHITCAFDPDNVGHVFYAVKDIVVRRALQDANLY